MNYEDFSDKEIMLELELAKEKQSGSEIKKIYEEINRRHKNE